MKSTGKGACILPHGVLFRGNAEAVIRRKLVRSGTLKGIIGLPANLFYGTGIPACILVLDKENAPARKGIFMIDASKGFIKDGNKNRLRERDLHQIVDVFTNAEEHPGYSRLVPLNEIEKNDFNLNLPRYIDGQEAEDIQDIGGHLLGGIPNRDIDALHDYWKICPELRAALFKKDRAGYSALRTPAAEIKPLIHGHPQFAGFIAGLETHFKKWRKKAAASLRTSVQLDCLPKQVIHDLSENLLHHAESQLLIDPYAVYQHLMDYWAATMQDDCYLIAADGWVAKTSRIVETDKKGKTRDKGWTCDLVPKHLIVARYFAAEQTDIDACMADVDGITATIAELEEEHGGEEGFLGALEKINKAEVNARLKELRPGPPGNAKPQLGAKKKKAAELGLSAPGGEDAEEITVLKEWLSLSTEEADLKKAIRDAEIALDLLAYEKYPQLTEAEIQTLVVDDKWLSTLAAAIQGELDRVSQTLTSRIRLLADRYAAPLPQLVDEVEQLAAKVAAHLQKMGAY
jgi:type I restriction enzyme M protein